MKEEKSHEKIEHPCKHRLIMSLMVVSPSAFAAGEESQTGTSNEVLGTSATQDVGVSYRTHVQNNGWETTWTADGDSAGTEGKSLRLEAIKCVK